MKQDFRTATKLEILQAHMHAWFATSTRSAVAQKIVETYMELGFCKKHSGLDIKFYATDDPVRDMRANAQKLYRWLGMAHEETHPQLAYVFELEPVIVAAMPEKIRMDYLAASLEHSGVLMVGMKNALRIASDSKLSIGVMAVESAESIAAYSELPADPTLGEALNAHREHTEAAAVHTCAARELETRFPQLATQTH